MQQIKTIRSFSPKCVHTSVVCVGTSGQKRTSDRLWQELLAVMSGLMWVLETKPGSYVRAKKMLLTTDSTLHSQDNSFFFISVFTYLLVILGIKPQALYKSITWPLAIFPSFL